MIRPGPSSAKARSKRSQPGSSRTCTGSSVAAPGRTRRVRKEEVKAEPAPPVVEKAKEPEAEEDVLAAEDDELIDDDDDEDDAVATLADDDEDDNEDVLAEADISKDKLADQ